MAVENIRVIQKCGQCGSQLGMFEIKKDNLMLISRKLIWCSNCRAEVREIRDIAGRLDAIDHELTTYPKPTIS